MHIEQFARVLSRNFGALQLLTIEPDSQTVNNDKIHKTASCGISGRFSSNYANITHTLLPAPGDNLLDRVLNFRRFLESWWGEKVFEVAHFRSPFEGMWLSRNKGKRVQSLVFEVNGLPSIELKYRYPQVAEDSEFIEKLMLQEQICIDAADLIITPSQITASFLRSRGADRNKIKVVPNAVNLETFTFSAPRMLLPTEKLKLIYFGTLTSWQGVEQALAAAAILKQERAVELLIIGAAKQKQIEILLQEAARLNALDVLTILPAVTQPELVKLMHSAHVILAPLSSNDRNLLQGCCPFKILEGMASGTPVLASALPVVQEIAGNEHCLFLAKPGSTGSIVEGIRDIIASPEKSLMITHNARRRIEANYCLERTGKLLLDAYSGLSNKILSSASR